MNLISALVSFLPAFLQQEARSEKNAARGGVTVARIPVANTSRQGVTPDVAQGLSAVYGCIDYISRMISIMPWRVIETTREGDRLVTLTHPIDPILWRRPNTEMTSFTLKHTLLWQCLSWGNGYAEIIFDANRRIRGLMPIESRRVQIFRDASTRRIMYRVSDCVGGKTLDFESQEIFHILAVSDDGIIGRSPLLDGTQSMGSAMAADRHAGAFFANQSLPAGVIELEGTTDAETREELRREWAEIYGGTANVGQTGVLSGGAKFKPITFEPRIMQLLETRRFNLEEICRFFGVPPQKIFQYEGQGMTATAEMNATIVTEALMPWMTRLEEEANRKLIGQDRFSTNLDENVLLRGTAERRWNTYRAGLQLGAMSVNQVLRNENMPGIGPSGDVHRMPLNMTTSEKFASPDFVPNAATPPGPGDGSSGGDVPEAEEGGRRSPGEAQ